MATGHRARELSEDEECDLSRDSECISDFKKNKLETEAKRNWDIFYKRNATHFFKDRHWIAREFPELLQAITEVDCFYIEVVVMKHFFISEPIAL